MTPHSRRLFFFAVALVGGLGLLAVLFRLLTQPPRPAATSPATATPVSQTVATIDGDPISFKEWEQAVALDQVMSALVGQASPSPEETLEQLINERLVLQAAVAADIPVADQTQAEAWLARFLVSWNLDETTLDQALARAGLTRADLMEEIVPRLLRVEQALSELPPDGDAEAWISDLRGRARVAVLENLSVPLSPGRISSPPEPSPQPTRPGVSLPTGPRVGDIAPDFSLTAADGTMVRLSDLRGRPVVLNFWATWCAPCRTELLLLQAAHQVSTGDVIVLGINVRESPDQMDSFAADLDLELPLLLDQVGQVSDLYQVRGMPTSLFVDEQGQIAARHVGPLDQPTLQSYLSSLLTAPASPSSAP